SNSLSCTDHGVASKNKGDPFGIALRKNIMAEKESFKYSSIIGLKYPHNSLNISILLKRLFNSVLHYSSKSGTKRGTEKGTGLGNDAR
ncbi:MAG: hypothetical protein RBS14_03940, partial [Atribacterota bacterium]|nr:hypothetical protein [Atribacterota bacterium]